MNINENGVLPFKLPKEWAENDVNVVLVLEFLNQLQEAKPQKESLAKRDGVFTPYAPT